MKRTENFYIYTDCEGKMPVLRYKKFASTSHRYFVRYVGDRLVECVPYPGQLQAWDYKDCCYVNISSIGKTRRRAS